MAAPKSKTVKLSAYKENPKNPRLIKGKPFDKLVKNILKYSKFLRDRSLIHKDGIIIGGNMRFKAIQHIVSLNPEEYATLCKECKLDAAKIKFWDGVRKNKAIPEEWVKDAADYDEDEVKAFIILDNRDFGEDDWETLANEWDREELESWNVNTGKWDELPTQTVSFQVNKKNDDDHVTFEQVMHIDNKRILIETMNWVKEGKTLDHLEDALMEIVTHYRKQHQLE